MYIVDFVYRFEVIQAYDY